MYEKLDVSNSEAIEQENSLLEKEKKAKVNVILTDTRTNMMKVVNSSRQLNPSLTQYKSTSQINQDHSLSPKSKKRFTEMDTRN